MDETKKTSSVKIPILKIGGVIIITIILGFGFISLPIQAQPESINQIIFQIQKNSKDWLIIEEKQRELENETIHLRQKCLEKSIKQWGNEAFCPIDKKKLNF